MHAPMLLTPNNYQIIDFFDVTAANELTVLTTLFVVGDERATGFQISDQFIELVHAFGLRVIIFQELDDLIDLSLPEVVVKSSE